MRSSMGMAKKPKLKAPKGADDYPEAEAAKRRDIILKRMLETPRQPRVTKQAKPPLRKPKAAI